MMIPKIMTHNTIATIRIGSIHALLSIEFDVMGKMRCVGIV